MLDFGSNAGIPVLTFDIRLMLILSDEDDL